MFQICGTYMLYNGTICIYRLDDIRTGDPVAWITCLCINSRSECSVLGHAKRANRYGQPQQEKQAILM